MDSLNDYIKPLKFFNKNLLVIYKIKENKNKKIIKNITNSYDNNLSIEDAIDELYNEVNVKENKNPKNKKNKFVIEIKGDMLIYDGRIFKINKNSNKYKAKEKRIIYFCQYYFKLLQKRKNEDLNPFCTMKITYYPDKEPDDQYKISGEHSAEYLELYNENKPIKNKILSDWNNFKS